MIAHILLKVNPLYAYSSDKKARPRLPIQAAVPRRGAKLWSHINTIQGRIANTRSLHTHYLKLTKFVNYLTIPVNHYNILNSLHQTHLPLDFSKTLFVRQTNISQI